MCIYIAMCVYVRVSHGQKSATRACEGEKDRGKERESRAISRRGGSSVCVSAGREWANARAAAASLAGSAALVRSPEARASVARRPPSATNDARVRAAAAATAEEEREREIEKESLHARHWIFLTLSFFRKRSGERYRIAYSYWEKSERKKERERRGTLRECARRKSFGEEQSERRRERPAPTSSGHDAGQEHVVSSVTLFFLYFSTFVTQFSRPESCFFFFFFFFFFEILNFKLAFKVFLFWHVFLFHAD